MKYQSEHKTFDFIDSQINPRHDMQRKRSYRRKKRRDYKKKKTYLDEAGELLSVLRGEDINMNDVLFKDEKNGIRKILGEFSTVSKEYKHDFCEENKRLFSSDMVDSLLYAQDVIDMENNKFITGKWTTETTYGSSVLNTQKHYGIATDVTC